MSLPYGLLGLLSYAESTGYDLTKRYEDSLNNFWHAQGAQIYRELKRMEDQGWVSSRIVIQDGRPNKRLYAITDEGRRVLSAWLAAPALEFENQHSRLLVRVFFGAEDPAATLALLRQCRDEGRAALQDDCAGIRQNIEAYAAMLPGGAGKRPYWLMTLDFGQAMTAAMVAWAERCIEQLEGMGR